MTDDESMRCEEQQRLAEIVQQTLATLAQLAHAEQRAVQSGDDQLIIAIDKQIESVMGEKERGMGALRQHRLEHGC
jgi:hypothetical protein